MSRIEEYKTYLEDLCRRHGVPINMVVEMLEIELMKSNMRRRHNLYNDLRKIIEKYLKEDIPR